MTRVARLVHRIMTDVGNSVVLVFKRLPTIAVYTLAFFVLFSVGSNLLHRYQVAKDERYYRSAPSTAFVNYTSFIVQPAREGEDVTFTLCRTHDQNYRVEGVRSVYIIPEGSTEDSRVLIYNKQIKGVIDSGNCNSFYIRQSEYHFKPGSYQLTLNLDFNVKYNVPKSVFIKSNVFKIRDPAGGSTDTQTQINNLKEQLQDLQQIINNLQPPVVSEGQPQRSTSSGSVQGTSSNSSGQTAATPPPSQAVSPSQQPQPTPQPSLLQQITNGILSPIRGIL